MMVNLTIDNQPISVPEGTSVLHAARELGIAIPTLCHVDGYKPQNSCLLCLVRVNGSPRLKPACSLTATEGMVIESEDDSVRAARRTAVELLLSDHAGDCLAPCQNNCPAHMDVPKMMRQIIAGDLRGAVETVKRDIPLPAVLGRICPAPCEGGCRRKASDAPVAVCLLKRYVADIDLAGGDPLLPPRAVSTQRRVAVIGSGPTGLSAAYYLQLHGHRCTIFDANAEPGGAMRSHIPDDVLPRDVLDAEIDIIRRLGATFQMNHPVPDANALDQLREDFDATLLAVGGVEALPDFGVSRTKRGVSIDGRTFQTSKPDIFAAGGAVRKSRLAVRSVAEGKLAAECIDRYLAGRSPEPVESAVNASMGKLDERELIDFMLGADEHERITPEGGLKRGFTAEEAVIEAGRCMQCSCAGGDACGIRQIAASLGADLSRYRGDRRAYRPIQRAGGVVFEPGKCIACGLCVEAVRRHAPAGLTLVGRGFDVHLAVPFGQSIDQGVGDAAAEAVRVCPTAALRFDAACETFTPLTSTIGRT